MNLKLRQLSPETVVVVSDWTTYTVFFSDDSAIISTVGLTEEYELSYFPFDAKNPAKAAYLVAQLELKSIE